MPIPVLTLGPIQTERLERIMRNGYYLWMHPRYSCKCHESFVRLQLHASNSLVTYQYHLFAKKTYEQRTPAPRCTGKNKAGSVKVNNHGSVVQNINPASVS